MKGMRMESDWRTVQLFISAQAAGIFEVEVDTETKKTRCNCPVWRKTASNMQPLYRTRCATTMATIQFLFLQKSQKI